MATYYYIFAERRLGDGWELIGEPTYHRGWDQMRPPGVLDLNGRDEMWTVLSGRLVRWGGIDHSGLGVISEPRGLPLDLSPVLREWAESHVEADVVVLPSWLMAQEILDFDWETPCILHRGFVAETHASLFDPSRPHLPFPRPDWYQSERQFCRSLEDLENRNLSMQDVIFLAPVEGTVEVHWTDSHLDYLGRHDEFFDGLRALGPPDEVRLVFWADQ